MILILQRLLNRFKSIEVISCDEDHVEVYQEAYDTQDLRFLLQLADEYDLEIELGSTTRGVWGDEGSTTFLVFRKREEKKPKNP